MELQHENLTKHPWRPFCLWVAQLANDKSRCYNLQQPVTGT
jgi:hypothetical protein